MIHAFDSSYGYKNIKHPTPFIDDDGVLPIGFYAKSRRCALACKNGGAYKIYASGLGNLSHNVLREIAREAGVHIYAENGTPVYINSGVVGVYNTRNTKTVVSLREDGEYTEIFSGKTYRTDNKKITLPTGECPAQMLILPSK